MMVIHVNGSVKHWSLNRICFIIAFIAGAFFTAGVELGMVL